jgi:hypothetical protein
VSKLIGYRELTPEQIETIEIGIAQIAHNLGLKAYDFTQGITVAPDPGTIQSVMPLMFLFEKIDE